MQNKLFALFLAVVVVIVMIHFMPKPLYKQIDVDSATCQVFCRSTTLPNTDVGFGKIVQCNAFDCAQVVHNCQGIDGVSFSFAGDYDDIQDILQRFLVTVHTTQKVGDLAIVCGYSPRVVGGIFVDGHKTNLQIAFDGSHITIGSPLILGSY